MTTTYTTDSVAAAGKLCQPAAGMPQTKAALAAAFAEAFINGMNAQQRLTTDAVPGK